MRNTQEVKRFYKEWKDISHPSLEIARDYQEICRDLLYEDEELVVKVVSLLKSNIENWAYEKSKIYLNLVNKDFIDKKDLLDKKSWFVENVPHQPMYTRGTTTGSSFHYRRWEEFLYFLECDNHYDLVLDEFNLDEEINVLFFMNIGINLKESIEIRKNCGNFMESHGIKRKCNVHHVNFNEFKKDRDGFFKKLIDHIRFHEIDVTLTTGPNINALCSYLKNKDIKIKVSKLLSNTNEMLLPETVLYIKENKVFDNICDHMRCWDGGASFFTCSHENYHLMDNISWCVAKDNRLISTDYFSFASPFVNYWNGDLCRIDNKFLRCDCGRLYRDFEFLENRPFLVKGKSITEIKSRVSRWKQIKEVRCSGNFLEIVCDKKLDSEDEEKISQEIHDTLNGKAAGEKLTKIRFSLESYG